MPGRGRASFTKRQKEHARQEKRRAKAERKTQRKLEKQTSGSSANDLGNEFDDSQNAEGIGPLDLLKGTGAEEVQE